MEFTQENLKTLYQRAYEVLKAKEPNVDPNRLIIENDGSIRFEEDTFICGDSNTEHYYITAEELTGDLDLLIAERILREAKEKEDYQRKRKEEEIRRAHIQKDYRKAEWEKLNKEFGNK